MFPDYPMTDAGNFEWKTQFFPIEAKSITAKKLIWNAMKVTSGNQTFRL